MTLHLSSRERVIWIPTDVGGEKSAKELRLTSSKGVSEYGNIISSGLYGRKGIKRISSEGKGKKRMREF